MFFGEGTARLEGITLMTQKWKFFVRSVNAVGSSENGPALVLDAYASSKTLEKWFPADPLPPPTFPPFTCEVKDDGSLVLMPDVPLPAGTVPYIEGGKNEGDEDDEILWEQMTYSISRDMDKIQMPPTSDLKKMRYRPAGYSDIAQRWGGENPGQWPSASWQQVAEQWEA